MGHGSWPKSTEPRSTKTASAVGEEEEYGIRCGIYELLVVINSTSICIKKTKYKEVFYPFWPVLLAIPKIGFVLEKKLNNPTVVEFEIPRT